MDFVIVREIQHSLNVPLDSIIAEADRNRLDNLGIFSEVSWRVVPLEDGTGILSLSLLNPSKKHRRVLYRPMMKKRDGLLREDGSFKISVGEIKLYSLVGVLVGRILTESILLIHGCLGIMFPYL